jgi:hypothetical protein
MDCFLCDIFFQPGGCIPTQNERVEWQMGMRVPQACPDFERTCPNGWIFEILNGDPWDMPARFGDGRTAFGWIS